MKKTIILIHSEGTNIGKSYLSQLLVKTFSPKAEILSFSNQAMLYLDTILPKGSPSFSSIYKRENKLKESSEFFPSLNFKGNLRDLITSKTLSYKNEIKDPTVFSKLSKDEAKASPYPLVIFDDFRLPYEYDNIVSIEDSKVITIKLSKKGINTENLSETSKAFENQLKDFNFDIDFVYNKDYSNTEVLLSLIKDNLSYELSY